MPILEKWNRVHNLFQRFSSDSRETPWTGRLCVRGIRNYKCKSTNGWKPHFPDPFFLLACILIWLFVYLNLWQTKCLSVPEGGLSRCLSASQNSFSTTHLSFCRRYFNINPFCLLKRWKRECRYFLFLHVFFVIFQVCSSIYDRLIINLEDVRLFTP